MLKRLVIILGFVALVAPPFIGRWIVGLPEAFTELPPVTQYVEHAGFSPPVFLIFLALGLAFAILMLKPAWFGFEQPSNPPLPPADHVMPWWGTAGLILTVVSWIGAWGRFSWLGPMNDHFFTPLWLGYIFTMDGLVYRRRGSSMVSETPARFASLFPASALLWWYFEYLNRFVQNWWYEGTETFSAPRYILFATFCFATVLPAMFETRDFIMSFDGFKSSFQKGFAWKAPGRLFYAALLALGIAGLLLMSPWPNQLFFLTWLTPLAVAAGTLGMARAPTCFEGLTRGDYAPLLSLALAAVVCGFFWEMWNFFSLPKWHYSVPYVSVARIFEMPLVGYGGYVPFGPICCCMWGMAEMLIRGRRYVHD